MKKLLLIAITLFISNFGIAQATNFTVNDCNATNHDLFTELNAGTVVVLTWVMPCSACISVAGNVSATVQSFASTNPGRVKFYLVDDYANTTCSSLSSWASSNGITIDASFSDAAISMSDYGTAGMQKTVVLGGAAHSSFYNVVGAVNTTTLTTAINNALTTSVGEISTSDFQISLFPNPATSTNVSLSYQLKQNSIVSISIYNELGQSVKNIANENQKAGKHQSAINLESLNNGIYFIKIKNESTSQSLKFTIAR